MRISREEEEELSVGETQARASAPYNCTIESPSTKSSHLFVLHFKGSLAIN